MRSVIDGRDATGLSLREFYERADIVAALRRWGINHVPLPHLLAPPETAALARINHGRLIVDCPDCGAAWFVWREGPHQVYCASCLNGGVNGLWRPVRLPEQLEQIEALLARRPLPQQRNWHPGETLAQLEAENIAMGVTEP